MVANTPNKSSFDLAMMLFGASNDLFNKSSEYFGQSSVSKMKADQYNVNSTISANSAQDALREGKAEAEIANLQRAKTIGDIKTAQGESGFVVGAGTAGKYIQHTDEEYLKTIESIRTSSVLKSNAYEMQAGIDKVNAELNDKLTRLQTIQGISTAMQGIIVGYSGYREYRGVK